MIGGAKGIGIGIDFGIPNQYCRATSKPYIEKDVLDSLRVVASAYGKSNNDSDRAIVKNLVDPDNPFVISNAAFKLNSGFGRYEADFLDSSIWISSNSTITSSKIDCKKAITHIMLLYYNIGGKEYPDIPSFKVIKTGANIDYSYIDETGSRKSVKIVDGVNVLPASYNTLYSGPGQFCGFENPGIGNSVTITQIPSFEGAFVTDGIDDLITSTKTVQEMLGGSNECTVLSMICQIGDTIESFNRNNWLLTPTSYLESRVEKEKTGKTGIYGYTSTDISNGQISNINTILGDKDDYTVNSKIESTGLDYFSVEGFQNEGIWYTSSVAWYWTIIANRVLTTDQINQVIAYFNLDRTLKPDILCNTIKQGITNENHAEFGDKLIDYSGNGRDIQLYNIAWKPGSGMGIYAIPYFTKWDIDSYYNGSYIDDYTGITVTDSKITAKEREPESFFRITKSMPKLRVNVKFYDSNDIGKNKAKYTYIDSNGDIKTVWLVDGINVLPESYQVQYTIHGFYIYGIGIDIEVNDDK